MTADTGTGSTPKKNTTPEASGQRPIRWWPALVILLLANGAVLWVRSAYGRNRQDQNIATANILIVSFLLLLLWWLLLSRLRRKVRLGVVGVVAGLVGLTPLLFRIHGVTGDLVPILEWRWQRKMIPAVSGRVRFSSSNAATQPIELTNDYPQFLGPHRNATVDQPRLARDWQAQPPQRLWRQPVGPGWSGFAVAGSSAITQEQRGENEAVVCYDLVSGALTWCYAYPAHYQSSLAGEGPRATPTVVGKRVYALGSTGILNCLDLDTGKSIWAHDIVQENHSQVSEWGISGSPLVVDELVVVSAGGKNNRSLVAYQAQSGKFVWGAGNDDAGYSSPCLATLAAISQILIFNSGGVCAHAPADGRVLWKYPWPGGHPHVAVPVVLPDDRVLVSSGYSIGSELLKIEKDSEGNLTATRLWKSNRLKANFTNVVYRGGFIYGLDDGIMVCMDASNGQQKWKQGRYGHGQEILVADLLLVTAESGEVILLEPTPEESRELAHFSALKEKTWNPPALAGQFLLVRNDKQAACYRLPVLKFD